MKKIRFLLVTLVALLAGVSSVAGKTVYIQPNDWTKDGAVISLWVWGDGIDGSWATLTTVEEGILKATFSDDITTMHVVRGSTGNDFSTKYNESGDIAPENGKLYSISGWDGCTVGSGITVSDYTEPAAAGYTVDFNTRVTTSNHDFAVAKGWGHIVPNSDYDNYGPYYMSYSYYESMGVDGSGCLMANRQYAGDNSGGEVIKDILVTPAVNGTVTLDVKAYSNVSNSNPAFVEVYAINSDGTLGSLLKTVKEDIAGYNTGNSTTWATFTLAELTTEQKLGLRCQYVYIDNFTASSVNIPAERKLEVTKVANLEGATGTNGTTTYFEQQADGKLKVQLQVTLTNTGDYAFAAGDENYTLTLASASYASGTKTYYDDATVAITEDLAAGESKVIDVDFIIPYSTGWKYYFVKENISGTTSSSSRYAGVTAYESKFVLREGGTTSTSDLTTAQDYGRVSATTTRSFEIYNDGTAPLTIKSITLPTGFTSDNLPEIPTEGLVVAKKSATEAFNVTLPVDVMGDFSGDLIIVYVKAGDTDATTKKLAFSGNVLPEGTWFADFNGDKSSNSSSAGVYPAGSVVTSTTTLQFGYTGVYGSYDHYLKPYASAGMLVMPKLTATAGAQLKYDAVRYQSGSSYTLKVYVSTDRNNMGEAKATINNSDLASNGNYTQTLTFDEAGDYYVAFELYGVGLDNVIGLTKTEVAHDVYFKATSLVAEAQTGKEIKPNVKVVPLTDETTESYTVKYYVDDVAVATADAIALTTSATADKTFTISYTPTDEVTTEHDTYIAFEFTDGTVIATDHQTLKVTNEPKFLFVAASTSVNDYSENLTTAQAFGKTNTADEKSFKIYNRGTAPLKVKSIMAPEGFSVNKADEFVVAAGDNEDIIVTFSTETPGEYSGNLVVTYEQEGTQTYELTFSGTKLDPNKWYANFDNPTSNSVIWPGGLVYESNIQTSYSGYGPYNCFVYTSANNTENNKLITPLLNATAGDKFCFDVKRYSGWGTPNVAVYLSSDRNTWGEAIHKVESVANSDFETVEVTIPTTGNYYVGIAMVGVSVDELYGLKLADVAHDLKIASSNIPTEGMQNYNSTATVNVLNFGVATDKVTVTAYINGVAVATSAETEVAMNHKLTDAGTQVSVSYMSNVKGTFPVYLEVKAGDVTVVTDPVDVTFAEEVAISDAIEVGSGTTTSYSYAPIDFFNFEQARTSDILYTQAQLTKFGLKSGDKITTLAFKGSLSSAKTISNSSLKAWVALSSGDITYNSPDKSNMAEVTVYNAGDMAFAAGVNVLTINLPDAIIYDGTSDLRIYLEGGGNNEYVGLYFAYDTNYSNMKWSNATSMKYNPLLYVTLDAAAPATLAGKVQDSEGNGIYGATITLKADNGVQYSGNSIHEGNYSFDVIQSGLDFTVTVEAPGYLKRQFPLNMGGTSVTQDVTMYKQFGIVGSLPGLDWDNDLVMTQDAENPNIFVAEKNDVLANAGEYEFKLRADGAWSLAAGYYKPNFDNGTDATNGYTVKNSNYQWEIKTPGTYNYKFTFDWANHTLTFERPYTLAEDANGVVALNWVDVTIEREFKAGWNAVVLPFSLNNEEFVAAFGANSEVAIYGGDHDYGSGNVTVFFKKQDDTNKWIDAGVPYLIWLKNPVSGLKFTKDIVTDTSLPRGENFEFVGVYTTTQTQDGDYFVKNGEFQKCNTTNTVKPFRSYLRLRNTASPVRSLNFVVDDETITTEIDGLEIDTPVKVEGAYNLNGQKVENLKKGGLYIINGKKVIWK